MPFVISNQTQWVYLQIKVAAYVMSGDQGAIMKDVELGKNICHICGLPVHVVKDGDFMADT